MSGHNILGIDPGICGGLAIVVVDADGAAPRLIDAIDIPVAGVGAKERVDVLAIRSWIVQHAPQHALIERAQAMPKQGASSGFKYGRSVGSIEAVITCCAVPLTIIEPTAWKKFRGLRGGDKETSRQRALQLFPAVHALLARKKDHGRAEAALIALYGLHQFNRIPARAEIISARAEIIQDAVSRNSSQRRVAPPVAFTGHHKRQSYG
jgi:crossover junction endodeoxyribonuclease RuvC